MTGHPPDGQLPVVFVARPLDPAVLDRLTPYAAVDCWTASTTAPREVLIARAIPASGLLTSVSEKVDAELINACPNLRVVSNVAVGYDNFDVAALTKRRIPAGNTPGVLTEATADVAIGLLIAAARRLTEARDAMIAGEWKNWSPNFYLGQEISGTTLGIIGMGRIGEAVARRARGFSMDVVAWSRTERPVKGVRYVAFDELLGTSDFISINIALSPDTYHLIGARELGLMKPSAFLINTARGAVIDQDALVEALSSGVIAGAGLDVFEVEPIPVDDPLLSLANCVAVPHIGSATHTTRRAMAELAVDNVIAGLTGERLPACVNPEVYD